MIDAGGHLCFSVEIMNTVDLLYFWLVDGLQQFIQCKHKETYSIMLELFSSNYITLVIILLRLGMTFSK